MKPGTLKILAWLGVALGTGGTLAFFLLVVQHGPPPRWYWWLWPVTGAAIALVSKLAVGKIGKREPKAKGFFHLRLSDLLLTVMSIGVLIFIVHAAWGDEALQSAVAIGIGFGALLLLGFLQAERQQLTAWRRYAFSIGLPPLVVGALSTGTVLFLLAYLLVFKHFPRVWSFAFSFLSGTGTSTLNQPLTSGLRIGLCLLPIGLLLCWFALRRPSPPNLEAPANPPRDH